MTFFIRPRQDFTLSRMADAMRCLVCCDFFPVMHVYKESKKPVLIISMEGSVRDGKDLCEKAIATLVDMEHFAKNNFRIIELSPAEVLAAVDRMSEPNRCHICGVISHLFTVHTVQMVDLPTVMINVYYCKSCAQLVDKFEEKLAEIIKEAKK